MLHPRLFWLSVVLSHHESMEHWASDNNVLDPDGAVYTSDTDARLQLVVPLPAV